jgi:hypothetical protein
MDEPVEGGRVPGNPTPKVRAIPGMFVATFDERRLSLMPLPNEKLMMVGVRGNFWTASSMYINREIATALIHWLQCRVGEMWDD